MDRSDEMALYIQHMIGNIDYRLLDEIVGALPQLCLLEQLTFMQSPIYNRHLQILSHSSFSCTCTCLVFYRCSVKDSIESVSMPYKDVEIHGTGTPIEEILPLKTVWTNNLTSLTFTTLDHPQAEQPHLDAWGPLDNLTSLTISENSFHRMPPSLFPHLKVLVANSELKNPIRDTTPYPSTVFTEVEALQCHAEALPRFVSLPVRTLALYCGEREMRHRGVDGTRDLIVRAEPLLSQVTELSYTGALDSDTATVLQELLTHCQKLESLKIIFGSPSAFGRAGESIEDKIEVCMSPDTEIIVVLANLTSRHYFPS
jgi:hypothetical protein